MTTFRQRGGSTCVNRLTWGGNPRGPGLKRARGRSVTSKEKNGPGRGGTAVGTGTAESEITTSDDTKHKEGGKRITSQTAVEQTGELKPCGTKIGTYKSLKTHVRAQGKKKASPGAEY